MTTQIIEETARQVVPMFFPKEDFVSLQVYGSGHINTTFLLTMACDRKQKKYILQKINTEIFKRPQELMENIQNVTDYLREQIVKEGGDPERETLNILPTETGESYYQDEEGQCWRIYQFINHAFCYDLVEKPEDFYESAFAFGNFQRLLAGFDAKSLHETIPRFHDTIERYHQFEQAVKMDSLHRVEAAQAEIAFVKAHDALTEKLGKLQAAGKLPLRVTHNDTKLNNIMIDEVTGRGICVIDLDTVMPGLAVNDFGDSIRFGANTAYEDETDLTRVSCDLTLFECYTRGFLEGVRGRLTPLEIQMLPVGAMVMTFECGMRFLTDYLEGDTYFKIHREDHNLDRARCQFALLADMEAKQEQMEAIVQKYMGKWMPEGYEKQENNRAEIRKR